MTTIACGQPGCTGTILDGYCDVCGSPGGALETVLLERVLLEMVLFGDWAAPPGDPQTSQ